MRRRVAAVVVVGSGTDRLLGNDIRLLIQCDEVRPEPGSSPASIPHTETVAGNNYNSGNATRIGNLLQPGL